MTTITPDLATEEGNKLLTYQPGQTVAMEFQVESVTDTELTGTVTKCELAGEPEGEYEEEAPAPTVQGKKMPKAVVMVAVGGKK